MYPASGYTGSRNSPAGRRLAWFLNGSIQPIAKLASSVVESDKIMKCRSAVACYIAALGAAWWVGTGCASKGYEKGAATSEAIQVAATRLNEITVQLNKTISSMTSLVLTPGADLRAQYEKFSADVDTLQSLAADVRDKAKAMQDRGKAYFAAWDQQVAGIRNEDLRSRGVARKTQVSEQFQAINESYQKAKDLFRPLMSDLKDVQTYLSTDLTSGGLRTVRKEAARANAEAVPLREAIATLVSQFKALGVTMSTSGSVPQ